MRSDNVVGEHWDPECYGDWLEDAWRVRDAGVWPDGGMHWTERHLQCVWYDERLRPAPLTTARGESVEVVQPGVWNLEAGPDFLDAELRVGDARTPVRGDVEIHVRPGDWAQHHHGGDPRYANVVLHVTYFPGPRDDPALPGHWLRISLQEGLLARPGFSFADVDLSAYPHAILPLTPRPCGEALAALSPQRWTALLAAAGRHRLRERSRRLAARLRLVGDRQQVFYEETLAMLGARKNSGPFRRVAEMFPLVERTGGAPVEGVYARLLGTAGLLPDPQRLRKPEAQAFARSLWNSWFQSGGAADSVATKGEWTLSGIRPSNHPVRRLAAAAAWFADPRKLLGELTAIPPVPPAGWVKAACGVFTRIPPMPYWVNRQSFDGAATGRPVALVGSARIAAILTNVLVPLRMAEDAGFESLCEVLPGEDLGAPARETAYRLFGRDHNPALYARKGLLQQGLLAIHHDFCLRARAGCARCPLARHLREEGLRAV